MHSTVALFLAAAGVAAELAPPSIVFDGTNGPTAFLFETPATNAEKEALNTAFLQIMKHWDETFAHEQHDSFLAEASTHAANFKNSVAYSGYQTSPSQAACGNVGTNAIALGDASVGMAAFPGGIVSRIGNFSLAKLVDELAAKAQGPAAAQGGIGGVVGTVALSMTAAFVQEQIADALHIIPPMIAPAAGWNNQPLTCMPMVTGKNCLGAVFHPITASDFMTADVVDARLDGVIASFPEKFQSKVGPAPSSVYNACFSAYMSMHCASIFPKCSAPQSGNDASTKSPQRVPMCFSYCMSTLLACPGFWMDDIIGQCQDVAVPPTCSTAFFWRLDLLPPQLSSFDASLPASTECPEDLGLAAAAAAAM